MKAPKEHPYLQTLLNFLPEDTSIYWQDTKGIFLGCNEEAAQLFGLASKAAIDCKTAEEIPLFKNQMKTFEKWKSINQEVTENRNPYHFKDTIRTITNENIIVSVKKVPIIDSNNEVLGIMTSITSTKRVAVIESNVPSLSIDHEEIRDLLKDIILFVPGYVYWKDLEGRYLFVNDFLIKAAGHKSEKDVIGKTDIEIFGEEKGKIIQKNDKKIIIEGQTLVEEEVIILPNGKKQTMLSTKWPIRNNSGKIIGLVGNSTDVTAEKKAEALERENAINAMRVETINRFCRKLLHDIRSPLSTLRMLITVLCKATLEGDTTIDLVRIRGTAYRCIRRIEAMANSLLRQYRQQGSEEEPQIEPTLLMPLVVDALLEKRSTLSMEDIKLKQEMQGAHSLSSKVECFELVQIFSNLINNCAEAIVEKREKIGDKKAEGLVRFKMTEQKEHVHFAISDNGCGIPQNLLEDIFLKDKTTKKEGSGIGLFHAREGIDSWGGKIWAESEDGKGATMNILLPKSPVPPSWFATQIEVPKNGFLVVADDEPHLYYSIKKCVQEQNLTKDIQLVEIKTLSEFDEWYEKHKEENPVILMDYLFYNEQKRTGLDAIKENDLKNAILVTNIYDDIFLRKECMDAGVQLIPKNIIEKIPIKIL